MSLKRDLSPHQAFIIAISSIVIVKSHDEAILVLEWRTTMEEEIEALYLRNTWSLVLPPTGIYHET